MTCSRALLGEARCFSYLIKKNKIIIIKKGKRSERKKRRAERCFASKTNHPSQEPTIPTPLLSAAKLLGALVVYLSNLSFCLVRTYIRMHITWTYFHAYARTSTHTLTGVTYAYAYVGRICITLKRRCGLPNCLTFFLLT